MELMATWALELIAIWALILVCVGLAILECHLSRRVSKLEQELKRLGAHTDVGESNANSISV